MSVQETEYQVGDRVIYRDRECKVTALHGGGYLIVSLGDGRYEARVPYDMVRRRDAPECTRCGCEIPPALGTAAGEVFDVNCCRPLRVYGFATRAQRVEEVTYVIPTEPEGFAESVAQGVRRDLDAGADHYGSIIGYARERACGAGYKFWFADTYGKRQRGMSAEALEYGDPLVDDGEGRLRKFRASPTPWTAAPAHPDPKRQLEDLQRRWEESIDMPTPINVDMGSPTDARMEYLTNEVARACATAAARFKPPAKKRTPPLPNGLTEGDVRQALEQGFGAVVDRTWGEWHANCGVFGFSVNHCYDWNASIEFYDGGSDTCTDETLAGLIGKMQALVEQLCADSMPWTQPDEPRQSRQIASNRVITRHIGTADMGPSGVR